MRGRWLDKIMSKLVPILIAAALTGSSVLDPNPQFRIGITSALPHDPERLRKSQERQARKAARKAAQKAAQQAKSNTQGVPPRSEA